MIENAKQEIDINCGGHVTLKWSIIKPFILSIKGELKLKLEGEKLSIAKIKWISINASLEMRIGQEFWLTRLHNGSPIINIPIIENPLNRDSALPAIRRRLNSIWKSGSIHFPTFWNSPIWNLISINGTRRRRRNNSTCGANNRGSH